MSTRIAFLGTGTMGEGMARRLMGAGFSVTVYNRTASRAAPLGQLGAHVAATPAEAARDADVLIAMLADDVASREVWLGQHGALTTARPGSICIECSTLTVAWVKELAADCASRDLQFLDAPVGGTKSHAAEGQLRFFVGGKAATLEAVRPVLAPMSQGIYHVGPVGAGVTVKLINNFLCGVQGAALAEGLAWLQRTGLDAKTVIPALLEGPAGSPMVKTLCSRHEKKDYTPNFQLHLMAKDLAYAFAEGKHHGITLQTATAALFRFTQADKAGLGHEDFSALLKFLEQTAHA
jgi:3-hydroxyisobutyrate dehydrogenase